MGRTESHLAARTTLVGRRPREHLRSPPSHKGRVTDMAITQQNVKDAWGDKDMKDWIRQTFTIGADAAAPLPLPDYQTRIPDLGLCNALTRSPGALWRNKGDTGLGLVELNVTRF